MFPSRSLTPSTEWRCRPPGVTLACLALLLGDCASDPLLLGLVGFLPPSPLHAPQQTKVLCAKPSPHTNWLWAPHPLLWLPLPTRGHPWGSLRGMEAGVWGWRLRDRQTLRSPLPQLSDSKDAFKKTWNAKFTLRSHYDGIRSLAFHHSQSALLTASEDGTLKLWNLQKAASAKK